MNQKVKELGCENTHFTNPHGYHDNNHYSTAYDMAIIFRYCLKNEIFRKIIGTKEITIKAANSDNELNLKNSNRMLDPNYTNTYYEYLKGGKTGYTLEARGTLVNYAIKDDKTIITASFDGSQNVNGNQARYLDSTKLFEYTFKNYSKQLILNDDDYTFEIYDKSNSKHYTIKLENDIYGLVKELPNITYDINIDYDILDKKCGKKSDSEFDCDDNIVGTINFQYEFKNDNFESYKVSNNTYNLVLINDSPYYSVNYGMKFMPFIIALLSIFLVIIYKYYKKLD